ncbi:helix-turn-helix transcriptional regulator [Thermobifida halotolerans]|uniref:Helix-turn-helix transcriptional regulator n=1 Tax=Thermobifida halotolerans TaxID=483545 RepID=A0AA97M0N8_9ACTN|nr:helix-turn-helix transcriptional regulator [Thermobifida halotolerans]UOE21466.1 helix-turn-helix transcriptional regulator [Thermobifida halotolerans]
MVRLLRRHTDLTQEAIAHLVGLSQGMVSRLESGKRTLRDPDRRRRAWEGLEAPQPVLSAAPLLYGAEGLAEALVPSFRTVLDGEAAEKVRGTGLGSAGLGGRFGEGDLARLRSARSHYEEMYRRVGGIPVRPRLARFLATRVMPVLSASCTDEVGRRLFRTAGSLTALAGICAYDARDQVLARKYFRAALHMAKASGDRGFGGYVVALLANQAMSMSRYPLVVQYTETALGAGRGRLSPALVSDLRSMQARAYARLGDRAACHEQMGLSEAAANRIRYGEEPSETSYVQPGLMETQFSEALRRLGDLKAAEEYALESLETADAAHLRGQVHRYAGLAVIRAQSGSADEALEPAREALLRIRGVESGRLHDRIRSVQSALGRSSTPEVREFREQVDAELALVL